MTKKEAGWIVRIKQKQLNIYINQQRPEFSEELVIERRIQGLFLRFQKLNRKALDKMVWRINLHYNALLQDEARKRESKADQSGEDDD